MFLHFITFQLSATDTVTLAPDAEALVTPQPQPPSVSVKCLWNVLICAHSMLCFNFIFLHFIALQLPATEAGTLAPDSELPTTPQPQPLAGLKSSVSTLCDHVYSCPILAIAIPLARFIKFTLGNLSCCWVILFPVLFQSAD